MKFGCQACDQSIAQACAVPPKLCGLCKLMPAEKLAAYFAKWGRAPAAENLLERSSEREEAA